MASKKKASIASLSLPRQIERLIILNAPQAAELAHRLVPSASTHVIGVDGAANKLTQLGIKVDIAIGDGDSSGHQFPPNFVHATNQDQTDFEKTITHLNAYKPLSTIIVGISGGELDHVLGNIQVMVKHALFAPQYLFIDGDEHTLKLGALIDSSASFMNIRQGGSVSLIPFPEAVVTTSQLRYNLETSMLQQTSGVLGLRNEALTDQFSITVSQGLLLVICDIQKP